MARPAGAAWLPGAATTTCFSNAAGGYSRVAGSMGRCWRGAPSFEGEIRPALRRLRPVASSVRPGIRFEGPGMRDGVIFLAMILWLAGEVTECARDTRSSWLSYPLCAPVAS